MDSLPPDLKWLYQVAIKGELVDCSYPDRISLCKQMDDLPANVPARVRIELLIGLRILAEHEYNSFFDRYDRFCKDVAMLGQGSPQILDEDSEAPGPASNHVTGSKDENRTTAYQGRDENSHADSKALGSASWDGVQISPKKELQIGEWDGSPVTRGGETSTLSASIRDGPSRPSSPYDMPSPNPKAEKWVEHLLQELLTEEPVQLAELLKGQDGSEIASIFYLASVLSSDGKIKMTQDERGEVFVSKVITD